MKRAQKFLVVLASACLLMSAIAGLSHISAQQSNFPPGGTGSMTWPSGSGFAIVASGASWGTTLTDPLVVGHGGTGTASTLAGIVRGGSPMTASELSGVITTSGSNVTSYAIANTTFTVSNATFSANTCTKLDSTAGSSTVTMTGMATSSVISIAPAADTATIVGFGTAGGLVIDAWPTSNTANIKVCNQTASGITTGATLVFNISAR